jgi:E3 ubiquitin-protein ligase RNF216
MEEAMTAALVRQCPSCHKFLIKDDGCNKLTRACRTHVCNVCKKHIMGEHGYGHFDAV